jgi:hypothetical protein
MDGGPRRFELEVRFEPRPISGRLYDREGRGQVERRFSGWLGLMSAIEAAGLANPAKQLGQRGEQQ